MVLKKINYQGFRNLVDAQVKFVEGYNFIIGENGSGKTNLLEAIFYAGLASSFRAREERDLIRFDNQFLTVDAMADGKKAAIYLDRDRKKVTLQGNEVRRLSHFVGWLDVTFLSIEDIWIIRGAPAKRRYFLDWLIAKLSPTYLSHLVEYRKIVKQRNKVLQMINENGDGSLLEVYDEQFIKHGNELYKERKLKLPELQKHVSSVGARFGLCELSIDYQSTCPHFKIDHSFLGTMRQKEIVCGTTLIGPHRDDLIFSRGGRPLRNYASEGEERAVSIALKLAEAEMLYEKKNVRPILLLDEVGAELDHNKKEILLGLMKGQIFYASTQMPEFTKIFEKKQCTVFTMKRGSIEVSRTN
jgi:DNA replication and repair protein RecF